MTEIDPTSVEGWSHYAQTRDQLAEVIETLTPKALELLVDQLGRRPAWEATPSDELARPIVRGSRKRRAHPTKTTVQARFAVPAANNQERLRIQFLGGYGDPLFTVEARRSGAERLLAGQVEGAEEFTRAVQQLKREEPPFETDGRSYVTRKHGSEKWLEPDGTSIHERLLGLVKRDVAALVASGILDPTSGFDADPGVTVEEEPTFE